MRIRRTQERHRAAPAPVTDAGDITLAAYEARAKRYLEETGPPTPCLVAFLDRLAELVGAGHVLEVGSGPGWDATCLEAHGLRVTCTDATLAFVEMARAAGREARLLDVRTDDLGGPYEAILADAVLLHLTREQFEDVLQRARRAVVDGGVLAFTVKEGDGAEWSYAKLGLPRYFTYWREPAVRSALTRTGWNVVSLDHVAERTEQWLFVLASTARPCLAALSQEVDAPAPGTFPHGHHDAAHFPGRPMTRHRRG